MKICVVGLGHVGIVNIAYLLERGHIVTGLDVSQERIRHLFAGEPEPEPHVSELLSSALRSGRLQLSTNYLKAVEDASVAIICVGTPQSEKEGIPNLSSLYQAVTSLVEIVNKKRDTLDVVLRSTVPPGTTRNIASGACGNFGNVWYYPEFLREGSAMEDMNDPPIRIIGAPKTGYYQRVLDIYGETGPVYITEYEIAEMVKYVCNAFHAMKVTFTNEISNICRYLGIDSNRVMEVVCSDNKLNMSKAYMRPGFAFGGSCLPKDLTALLRLSNERQGPELPLLTNIIVSNDLHIKSTVRRVRSLAVRGTLGMLGLSFKPNTGDLRDSPFVKLGNMLISEGYHVIAYDPSVELGLLDAGQTYIQSDARKIWQGQLARSLNSLCECSLLLIAHPISSFHTPILPILKGKHVLDLCNDPLREQIAAIADYEGVGWESRSGCVRNVSVAKAEEALRNTSYL